MGAGVIPVIKAIGVWLATTAVGKIVTTVLINVALGQLSKMLSKKPRTTTPPVNVTVRNAVENRRIILGTIRAGGTFAYYDASGTSAKYLWYVIVYAGHQCAAIKDVWLDNVRVPSANINSGAAGGGAVVGGAFDGKLEIWKHLGTSSQTVDSSLTAALSSVWTANHRLRGCAYIVARMERSDEKYPQGAPQSISALIDGALMYDPRKDSTVPGGSGAHRKTNPSTWEFGTIGRNPALHTRWFITGGSVHNDLSTRLVMYGLRESDARVPDAYVIAAANKCDETIGGGNAPPSGSQARYRCDLEVSTGETRRDILEDVLASMAGTVVIAHGQYRVYAGAYDTPTHAFDQNDVYGALEIEDTFDHERRYNQVAGVYRDAAKQWIEQTSIFRKDPSYETQDGGKPIPIELDLRAVTDVYQAQRLCEIKLRKSRMMRSWKMVGALNLMKVAVHETLTYTHPRYGWSARIGRTVEKQFEFIEEAGRVSLTCEREDPGVYTDILTADYTAGTSDTDVFVQDGPDTPTNLIAAPYEQQFLFLWTLPAYRGPGFISEIWEHTAASPFSSATKVWEGEANVAAIRQFVAEPRYYWLRFRNGAGQVSATYPATNGLQVQSLFLDDEMFDSFEHQDVPRFYNIHIGSPTLSYPLNGENGGRVLRCQNFGWFAWKQNIPYDPTALYMMEARVRMVQAATGGVNEYVWFGAEGVAADGVTWVNSTGANSSGSQHYFCASGYHMGAPPLNSWVTFRGYIKGFNTSTNTPGPNISNPSHMYNDTIKFMRPLMILNYDNGDGIMEVDYVKLERVVVTRRIEPNAATEIADSLTAGPITVTQSSSSVNAETLSFTAPSDGMVVVTIAFDGIRNSGSNSQAAAWVYSNGSVIIGGTSNNIVLTNVNLPYIARNIVPISEGAAIDVSLHSKHIGANSTSFSNISIQAEIIKR